MPQSQSVTNALLEETNSGIDMDLSALQYQRLILSTSSQYYLGAKRVPGLILGQGLECMLSLCPCGFSSGPPSPTVHRHVLLVWRETQTNF